MAATGGRSCAGAPASCSTGEQSVGRGTRELTAPAYAAAFDHSTAVAETSSEFAANPSLSVTCIDAHDPLYLVAFEVKSAHKGADPLQPQGTEIVVLDTQSRGVMGPAVVGMAEAQTRC